MIRSQRAQKAPYFSVTWYIVKQMYSIFLVKTTKEQAWAWMMSGFIVLLHHNVSYRSFVNPFPNKSRFLRFCSTSLLENPVAKGEIARNEQFLLFPQCFLPILRTFCHCHQIQNCRLQTLSVWKSLNFVVWERVNALPLNHDFLTTLYLKKKTFENTLGKGENSGYQNFLHFPQCFLPFPEKNQFFIHIYIVFCKCFQFGPVQNLVVR